MTKPATPTESGYSSPPCYAAEFPGYFGEPPATPPSPELVAALNALLEAERAGAKVLALLARDPAAPLPPALQPLLQRLQQDEGANAVTLYQTLRRLGAQATHATGDFVAKTLAVEGLAPRLRFLNKGQMWVVRKIDQALALAPDPETATMLATMRQSHLDNVAACEAALGGVEANSTASVSPPSSRCSATCGPTND